MKQQNLKTHVLHYSFHPQVMIQALESFITDQESPFCILHKWVDHTNEESAPIIQTSLHISNLKNQEEEEEEESVHD